MSRRALVFNVPPGREVHYSKIKGEYIGKLYAPLFHAYGYYLPLDGEEDPVGTDKHLKEISKEGLRLVLYENLLLLPLGVNAVLFNIIGSVLWAESESYFAYWDGHVSFGSSHMTGHWIGYSFATLMLKKGLSFWTLPLLLFAVKHFFDFFSLWKHDGFKVTGELVSDFRTDHLAHMGGVVAGALTAWVTRKKRLY